jgi:hypothetical protein
LVAPTDGVSWSGSPVGSTTTYGMPRAASCSRIDSLISEKTAITAGRPAGQHALHPASPWRSPALHLAQDNREVMLPRDPLHPTDDLERPLALELVKITSRSGVRGREPGDRR